MSDVCIPNIGPRERKKRLALGLAALTLGLLLASAMLWLDVSRVWRLAIFLPALMAALGVRQATAQTCVRLSAMGVRNLDSGNQRVTDSVESDAIRRQAAIVNRDSVLFAAGVTVLFVLA
jgi:hypothetical protein